MVYFTKIQPTSHYLEHHAKDIPWDKVVEIIFSTKSPRKKQDKYEIEQDGYYILFEIRENIIYIINAKRC